MAYCTEQDLIARFGEEELLQLTDRQGLGTIDPDVLEQAMADADDEINGYLASRYPVPMSPIPRVLRRIACELTRYYLYKDGPTELVEARRKRAVEFLEQVSKGRASIGITTAGSQPKSRNTATMVSGGNVFNRNDKSFI